jgi:hypothetical protein
MVWGRLQEPVAHCERNEDRILPVDHIKIASSDRFDDPLR